MMKKHWNLLFYKDEKIVLRSITYYLFLLILTLLTGNSFITATKIYSNSSIPALADPLYARVFQPVPGVFTPLMGSFYLLFTLILPFLIIPLVSEEKHNNTLLLLYDYDFTPLQIIISKFLLGAAIILGAFALIVPSIIFWVVNGGHLPAGELLYLFSGYYLYGVFVLSLSIFAGTIFNNMGASSILTLSIILSAWIIDFVRNVTHSKLIDFIAPYTFTSVLKYFEKGIIDSFVILFFPLLSSLLLILSVFILDLDRRRYPYRYVLAILLVILTTTVSLRYRSSVDITESRRNSFPDEVAEAIKGLPPVKITIYMRRTDSRYIDYNREFLSRFSLIKRPTVVFPEGEELEKNYGEIRYSIEKDGKWISDTTYSNSPEEAFQILSRLSGTEIRYGIDPYPGYPLVIEEGKLSVLRYIYYAVFPLLLLLSYLYFNSPSKREEEQ